MVVTENDLQQNIAVPTLALDTATLACWSLSYTVVETTSVTSLSSVTGSGTTLTLDSASAATNFVVPDLTGVPGNTYYDFTYQV